MPRKPRSPGYLLHKASGQAVCIIHGKTRYLGPYGSEESRDAYHKAIAEFAAAPTPTPEPASYKLTVVELIAAYVTWAEAYYVKAGRVTGQYGTIVLALRPLRKLYGDQPAESFGPKALKAVRASMIADKLARGNINQRVGIVKRMFKWAASEELVSVWVFQALATVAGLRAGRSAAKETEPVKPVDDATIDATLPHLPPIVADMVRIARWTGCRPGELVSMRPCDIDRSGDVWLYRPQGHKTTHLGKQRIVCIGPRAQQVLLPYLLRDAQAYCFSAAESEARRMAELRERRKTPVQPSQVNRKKRHPRRKPAGRYDRDAVNVAIHRAVEKANKDIRQRSAKEGWEVKETDLIPHWSANMLRHAAATEIRKLYGLEAAQTVLGHSRADVTQTYAERDLTLAASVAKKIG